MSRRASSIPQLLISIKARIVPSSQKLYLPDRAARLSASVLKVSSSSSGGEKSEGCPASITRSSVEPERGGERTKTAGGFLTAGGGADGATPIVSLTRASASALTTGALTF